MAARVRCAWVERRSGPVTQLFLHSVQHCTQCRIARGFSRGSRTGHRGPMHSNPGQDVLSDVQICRKDSSPTWTHRKKPHDSAVWSAAQSDHRPLCCRFGHGMPLPAPERISGTLVDNDLDEAPIGVAHVEAADSATSACPLDGAAFRREGAARRRRSHQPWGRSCWWDRGAGRARCR